MVRCDGRIVENVSDALLTSRVATSMLLPSPRCPCSDDMLMYGMQHIEDKYSAVIVTFILRVLNGMTVYVSINIYKLPDSEFRWARFHSIGRLSL